MRNSIAHSRKHAALLTRVQALESQTRYAEFFTGKLAPTTVAFFSDRIPFRVGALDRKAKKMFFHVWLYWDVEAIKNGTPRHTPPLWVPPNAITQYGREGDWS